MMLAIAVETTGNRKTGPVSVTHASQASCPTACPFLKQGCYAEYGPQGIITRKLNKEHADPLAVAQVEARAILSLTGSKPLRLHIVGDCSSNAAATIVSNAAINRFNEQPIWGYTHAWKTVSRTAWSRVSILASVETNNDAHKAIGLGYAPAKVVGKFASDRAWNEDGLKMIPCPEQTRKSESCMTCRLCWNDKGLLSRKAVIVFAAHGTGVKKVRSRVSL